MVVIVQVCLSLRQDHSLTSLDWQMKTASTHLNGLRRLQHHFTYSINSLEMSYSEDAVEGAWMPVCLPKIPIYQ